MTPDGSTLPDNLPTFGNTLNTAIDAQIRVIRSLYEVATAPPETLNEALSHVTQAVVATFNIEYATIQLFSYPRQITEIVAEFPDKGHNRETFTFSETAIPAYFSDKPDAPSLVLDNLDQPDLAAHDPNRRWTLFAAIGAKSGLIVPLRINETLLGTLNLIMISEDRAFSAPLIAFVQMIANLIAVSIQNVRLSVTLHTQIEQVEQIADFGRRIIAIQDQGQVIREAAQLTHQYLPLDNVSVALHWPGDPTLVLHLVDGDRLLPSVTVIYEQAWLRYAYENRMPLVLNTLTGGTQLDYEALVHHALPNSWGNNNLAQAALIIPLIAGGQPIGTFNLTRPQNYSYSPDDLRLGSQIAVHVAVALENLRLFAQTAEQLRSERLRAQLGGRANRAGAERVDDILITTLQQVGSALGAQRARVRLAPRPSVVGSDLQPPTAGHEIDERIG